MDKTAQKRSVLNQLREKVNIPVSYLEGFFKPEFDRVMKSLKNFDDHIRAILTGKKIGDAEPPDGLAAKDLVKSARTNFNRREYIAGIVDLGNFHKKMFDITQDISKFVVDVNKIHNKFLFEGLPENYQKNLQSFRDHMDRKAELQLAQEIIKQAGIMDFFYNIGTKRGRALMAWEKKYPKQTSDLRDGGTRLVEAAQKLLDNTISYLKQMATARAVRRPDDYIATANKIKSEFDRFDSGDKGFKTYYSNVILPFLKIKDSIEQSEPKATNAVQPTTQPVVDNTKKTELGDNPVVQAPPSAEQPFPLVTPAYAPVKDEELEEVEKAPDTQRNPQPQMITADKPPRIAHQRFFQSLESLSQQDPEMVAKYISKYASIIQKQDPEVALELFAIAQSVLKG